MSTLRGVWPSGIIMPKSNSSGGSTGTGGVLSSRCSLRTCPDCCLTQEFTVLKRGGESSEASVYTVSRLLVLRVERCAGEEAVAGGSMMMSPSPKPEEREDMSLTTVWRWAGDEYGGGPVLVVVLLTPDERFEPSFEAYTAVSPPSIVLVGLTSSLSTSLCETVVSIFRPDAVPTTALSCVRANDGASNRRDSHAAEWGFTFLSRLPRGDDADGSSMWYHSLGPKCFSKKGILVSARCAGLGLRKSRSCERGSLRRARARWRSFQPMKQRPARIRTPTIVLLVFLVFW